MHKPLQHLLVHLGVTYPHLFLTLSSHLPSPLISLTFLSPLNVCAQTDVDDLLPAIYGSHANPSSSPCDTYVKPDVPSSLRDQRLNSVSEETFSRLNPLPTSEASVKSFEATVHRVEAYASVYDRRSNLTSTDVPRKLEVQPAESVAMHVSDHLQEYVTMTPTSDPGTLEGGAFANVQQRIGRLEENRKDFERAIEQVCGPVLVWYAL